MSFSAHYILKTYVQCQITTFQLGDELLQMLFSSVSVLGSSYVHFHYSLKSKFSLSRAVGEPCMYRALNCFFMFWYLLVARWLIIQLLSSFHLFFNHLLLSFVKYWSRLFWSRLCRYVYMIMLFVAYSFVRASVVVT